MSPIPAKKDSLVEGAQTRGAIEHMRRPECILQPHLPLISLREGLLGAHHQDVWYIVQVLGQKEVGEVPRGGVAIHVPRAHKDADRVAGKALLQLTGS